MSLTFSAGMLATVILAYMHSILLHSNSSQTYCSFLTLVSGLTKFKE